MSNNKLILFFLILLLGGCTADEASKSTNIDEDTSWKSPARKDLPQWLNEEIDLLIESYVGKPVFSRPGIADASVYKGEWKNQTVYLVQSSYSSCKFCFVDKNGRSLTYTPSNTPIDLQNYKLETILPGSKNWKVIFQIIEGKIVEKTVKMRNFSDDRTPVVDKYLFPDISGMNDWMRPNIIQERLDALQMPDALLATISTEGLLETCLEFPYLIDIFHANNFSCK